MKKIKRINMFIIAITCILNTICFFKIGLPNPSRLGPIISLYFVLFLPTLGRKFCSIHPILELIYLIFIFIAQFLGSVINLYSKIEWYDLFAHTISGFLSGYIAIYLLMNLGHFKEKNLLFQITYILGIVFLIAGLWEMCEFGFDSLLGSNTQHSIETGVADTMEDMIVAFLGGLMFILFYSYEILKDKSLLVRNLTHYMK